MTISKTDREKIDELRNIVKYHVETLGALALTLLVELSKFRKKVPGYLADEISSIYNIVWSMFVGVGQLLDPKVDGKGAETIAPELFKSGLITPYYDTDYNLLRWLKGHDYNLEIITPKLINHLILRKMWDLDTLADKPRDHIIHKHWKSGLTGEAVKTPNCVVNIEQTGGNDYWGLLSTYPINVILRARLYDLESMLRAVMELEKKNGEQCAVLYIMDMTGLKMDRKLMALVTGGLAAISAFMAEHYVEMIHSFVLVNVPSFISAVWTVARPLLPEKTRLKVNILGAHWKDEIRKLADEKCLPTYWNEEWQAGPFLAPIERGVEFPEDGYYKGEIPSEAQLLQVPAGKSAHVDIEAKEGTHLSWELHANGHFSFTIYEVNKDEETDDLSKMKMLYPLFSKVPGPTMVPFGDSLPVEKTGVYRFWFGNQHAWFHTLRVHHIIKSEK